jgi:C4-dicarboxylate transporter DctM subunit
MIAFILALFYDAFIHSRLTSANLLTALKQVVGDTGAVAVILAAASPFVWILTF